MSSQRYSSSLREVQRYVKLSSTNVAVVMHVRNTLIETAEHHFLSRDAAPRNRSPPYLSTSPQRNGAGRIMRKAAGWRYFEVVACSLHFICISRAQHQMASSVVTISGDFLQDQPWKFDSAYGRRRPTNLPENLKRPLQETTAAGISSRHKLLRSCLL
jgi:hypothetical protein